MKKNSTFPLLVIAFVLLGLFLWQRKKPETNEHAEQLARMQERMEAHRRNQKNKLEERMKDPTSANSKNESKKDPGSSEPNSSSSGGANSPTFQGSQPFSNQLLTDPTNAIEKESMQALQAFSSVSKLFVPPIAGIQFVPYDYDEGVEAITGSDVDRGLQLTLFARAGAFTEQQFLDYLKTYPQGIPGLEGLMSPNLGEGKTIELTQGSGLNSVRYWTVQNGGKTVYLAMIPRKDGKGTYFASVVGSDELDKAEDFYYETLTQMKALD